MDTVENSEVRSNGGKYEIWVGVEYDDTEDPEYTHSVVWRFEPLSSTSAQNARFRVCSLLHKKYWERCDRVLFTEEDGSEIIESNGLFGEPINPKSLPQCVQEKITQLFGESLAKNTFEVEEGIDIGPEDYPEQLDVIVPQLEVRVDGSYTEELPEDDPRTGGGHFESHIRDENGEIEEKRYYMNHSCSWWITPKNCTEEAQLGIEKCYHKTWDKENGGPFSEDNPGERLVEAYRESGKSPHLDSLPESIKMILCKWFGTSVVRRSLSEASLPEKVYKCFNCDEIHHSPALSVCPDCGQDGLLRVNSIEDLRNMSSEKSEIAKFIANQDITISESSGLE